MYQLALCYPSKLQLSKHKLPQGKPHECAEEAQCFEWYTETKSDILVQYMMCEFGALKIHMKFENVMRGSPKLKVRCDISYERLIGLFFPMNKPLNGYLVNFLTLENFAFPQQQVLQPNLIFQRNGEVI